MVATSPKSRKAKGREFQNVVRDQIMDCLGMDEKDILSAPMGHSGPDLILSAKGVKEFPFSVEIKRQENISLGPWIAQAKANAEELGLPMLLIFRKNRGESYAVLRWNDMLNLVKLIKRELKSI